MRTLSGNSVHGKSWTNLTYFMWSPISKSGRPTNSSHGRPYWASIIACLARDTPKGCGVLHLRAGASKVQVFSLL